MAKTDKLGNQQPYLGGVPGQSPEGNGLIDRLKGIYRKIKSGEAEPEDLVAEDSIATRMRDKMDPERRMHKALEPTRQKTPPQRSHRDHYNDQEDYN